MWLVAVLEWLVQRMFFIVQKWIGVEVACTLNTASQQAILHVMICILTADTRL
jgi:hypothetical protein